MKKNLITILSGTFIVALLAVTVSMSIGNTGVTGENVESMTSSQGETMELALIPPCRKQMLYHCNGLGFKCNRDLGISYPLCPEGEPTCNLYNCP